MACGRTTPLALRDLAGLVVLQRLNQKALKQEYDYMEKWRKNLSRNAANLEDDLSLNNVDATEVILKVSGKLKEQEARARAAREMQRKKKMEEEMMENKRVTRGTKRKAQEQSALHNTSKKNATKKNDDIGTCNSSSFRNAFLLPLFSSNFGGIPEGVEEEEYIRYRKCLYVENIRSLREQLLEALTPDCIETLLQLVFRMEGTPQDIAERSQIGIFTLKVILFNRFTHKLKFNCNEFNKNFVKTPFLLSDEFHSPVSIENRIGPTILRSSLLNGASLTYLSLPQTCTDGILECVGKTARNLKYLNISGSSVTDQGLFHLIGVENDGSLSRRHLSRTCKQKMSRSESLVKGKNPRWIKLKDRGADKLQHLEAFNLNELRWPLKFGRSSNCTSLPIDAGFIAILDFVPELKVLHTEVGCRAVQTYHRYYRLNHKKSATRDLNLESLAETRPNPALIECVAKVCPKLSRLTVQKKQDIPNSDGWCTNIANFQQLRELAGTGVDLGSMWLTGSLPYFGENITVLEFDEVWVFKYSFIKAINDSCPKLTKLSIFMTNKRMGKKIKVEKDVDLRNITTKKNSLSNLKELHLIGPLFPEYVRYVIAGVQSLRCLTLGVEWPEESFCNVGPENHDKDLLGREYLEELRSINALSDLEEIHFFAQYSRGAYKLTEEFAIYLVNEFKKLKHLGTFKLWSKDFRPESCVDMLRHLNPSITFDEQYSVQNYRHDKLTFTAKNFQDSSPYSCAWLNIRRLQTFSFFQEMHELIVGQAFHWNIPLNDNEDDDDDSDSSSDFGDILQPLAEAEEELDEDDEDVGEQVYFNECQVQ